MTIKLVKRNQRIDTNEKQSPKPSSGDILATTQGWVEEFKTRKAIKNASMMSMLRRA